MRCIKCGNLMEDIEGEQWKGDSRYFECVLCGIMGDSKDNSYRKRLPRTDCETCNRTGAVGGLYHTNACPDCNGFGSVKSIPCEVCKGPSKDGLCARCHNANVGNGVWDEAGNNIEKEGET